MSRKCRFLRQAARGDPGPLDSGYGDMIRIPHINPSPRGRLAPPLARADLAAELRLDHRNEALAERAPVGAEGLESVEAACSSSDSSSRSAKRRAPSISALEARTKHNHLSTPSVSIAYLVALSNPSHGRSDRSCTHGLATARSANFHRVLLFGDLKFTLPNRRCPERFAHPFCLRLQKSELSQGDGGFSSCVVGRERSACQKKN